MHMLRLIYVEVPIRSCLRKSSDLKTASLYNYSPPTYKHTYTLTHAHILEVLLHTPHTHVGTLGNELKSQRFRQVH